jgi:hypothetical protein
MTDLSQPTVTPPVTPPPTTPPTPKTPDAPASILDEALGKATPADDAKPPEGAKPPGDKPAAGPPEKYADFTVPEGIELKGEILDKATGLFKELGLGQEQAQKLVDFHAAQLKSAVEGPAKLWQDTQEVWMDELRSDPVIGKGIDNGTVGASIAKMISALPAPQATAFREAMNLTGAGNNPAIVRGFYELSKKFAEPGHVQGNGPVQMKGNRPTVAEALYPNLVAKE